MLLKNKKALSEIVGYTILIVIAISLSLMVYSFLRLYVPKEQPSCNEDIVLILQDYACSSAAKQLNITITNKGLFKATAAYVRLGDESQKIRPQINNNSFLLYGPENTLGLNPGESSQSSYQIENLAQGNYNLEIQPVVIQNKQLIVCEKAVIVQPIQCT
ncbi:MAG TPA: hypothetical protein VI544_00440 [Candidatus Nanoarchaeia archaeon]|nr:hypothetical protein [Candidatus Nanoarchaeia archaeon]